MKRHRSADPILRAGPADLMFAALQRGVPQQFGAVLVLEPVQGFDAAAVTTTLADRVCAVPRLRQRLVKVPPGCGRPVWVEDPNFSIHRHIEYLACPSPGGEAALLDVAAKLVMRRLPMDHPLWHASVVTGLADRFLHTVVTDLSVPAQSMMFCATITDVLPLAVGGGGTVTVTFAALSYAGTLAITLTADTDAMPELIDTTAALQAELDSLTGVHSSPVTSQHAGG